MAPGPRGFVVNNIKSEIHMKKALILLLLLAAAPAAMLRADDSPPAAAQAGTGIVRVRITGLRSRDGQLGLALFNDRKGFPGKDRKAFSRVDISASGDEHVYTFTQVPFGTYALSVRHDENLNGKLDTNFLGMPKEGVGVSNNPHSSFGPPSFKDASFTLDRTEVELVVRLRYL
jgi:uncharacterized protein (DUF2141 family)